MTPASTGPAGEALGVGSSGPWALRCGSEKPHAGTLPAAAFLGRVPNTDVPGPTQLTQAKKVMSRAKECGCQQEGEVTRRRGAAAENKRGRSPPVLGSCLFDLPCATDGSEQVEEEMRVQGPAYPRL